MAGHSHWAQIKHKKAKADAQRGKIFTKIIREITVAVREGGPNPETNPRLRTAIENARRVNMPSDTIERAIKKGTGELGGENYEEVLYEGYAPNGVALMILTYTDNRNRTTSEIRHILSKHGGNLGSSGCVSFLFDRVGIIEVPKEGVSKGYSGKGDRCPWGGDGKSHRPYGHTVQNAKHKKGQGRMVSQSPGG